MLKRCELEKESDNVGEGDRGVSDKERAIDTVMGKMS